ncbi:MAG: LysM domain-containing protein [Bacillota bacterium]
MPDLINTDQNCASGRFYIIKQGETLTSIASKVGIPLALLISLNQGVDPDNLPIGGLLCLPEETPCPSGLFWEVSAGDTFYKIAQERGVSVEALRDLNPHVNPNNLQVGQILCLPERGV